MTRRQMKVTKQQLETICSRFQVRVDQRYQLIKEGTDNLSLFPIVYSYFVSRRDKSGHYVSYMARKSFRRTRIVIRRSLMQNLTVVYRVTFTFAILRYIEARTIALNYWSS